MKPFAKGAQADPAVSRGMMSVETGVIAKSAVAERREMGVKDNMVADICFIVENEKDIKERLDR